MMAGAPVKSFSAFSFTIDRQLHPLFCRIDREQGPRSYASSPSNVTANLAQSITSSSLTEDTALAKRSVDVRQVPVQLCARRRFACGDFSSINRFDQQLQL